MPLLTQGEPAPVQLRGEQAQSPFIITGDHAGALIPAQLRGLGLGPEDLSRHIACDLGAGPLAIKVGARLEACVVLQTYSRLVIDCNRPLRSPESILTSSDGTPIPGNRGLTEAQVAAREQEIFQPYHRRIEFELDRRIGGAQSVILIAMHSFTPVFNGLKRPWHAGVLYHRDARAARALLDQLRQEAGLIVGDNQPYAVGDETDYTIPQHGERRGIAHVGIEVRQDLIADPAGQEQWAERLARACARLHHALMA